MWFVLISLRVELCCCGFGVCELLFCFSSFVLDYCLGLVVWLVMWIVVICYADWFIWLTVNSVVVGVITFLNL